MAVEDTQWVRTELQNVMQSASLKLIEAGTPAPSVFEAMFIVGLAGLVEVEGKLAAAQRLAQVGGQLTKQVAVETESRTVN